MEIKTCHQICERCGEQAEYKSLNHVFCEECAKEYTDIIPPGKYICNYCHKEFTDNPVIVRYFPGTYCSNKCALNRFHFKEI